MGYVLSNLSIGRKLLLGFGLVVVVALGVASVGFINIFALLERGDLMTGIAESQVHLLRAKVAQQEYVRSGSLDLWISGLRAARPGVAHGYAVSVGRASRVPLEQ